MSPGSLPVEPPSSVVLVGAGTMGSGMAVAFARAGTRVCLATRRHSTLDRARARIEEALGVMVRTGALREAETTLERISYTTGFDGVDFGVDLVVESVAEDLRAKQEVLRRAEAGATASTVLATNTSSLPLQDLAAVLDRPQRFAGYHWLNPPELVRLVEVVVSPRTAEDTVRRLMGWSMAIGKRPVLVRREVDGFVANRLQYALLREAYALVDAGVCSVEDVDQVVTAGLGPRWAAVGPFRSMDLAGLDIHHEVARRLFPRLSNSTGVPPLLDRLVRAGALGAKTGRGLRGDYSAETVRRLSEHRARALLALATVSEEDG